MEQSLEAWPLTFHPAPYEQISTHVDDPREFVNELYRAMLEARPYFPGDTNYLGHCLDAVLEQLEVAGATAARRTKPPSLKAQALHALESADGADFPFVATVLTADQHALIRRALESLAEPEPPAEGEGPTLQLPEQAPDTHPPSSLDRREVAAWYHGHGCGWQAARAAIALDRARARLIP